MGKRHTFQANDFSLCRIRLGLFHFLSVKGWHLDCCCRSSQSTWKIVARISRL